MEGSQELGRLVGKVSDQIPPLLNNSQGVNRVVDIGYGGREVTHSISTKINIV